MDPGNPQRLNFASNSGHLQHVLNWRMTRLRSMGVMPVAVLNASEAMSHTLRQVSD